MSRKPFPFVWTPQRVARLVDAWNAGLPASALAERFGISAASIMSKIYALRAVGVELRMCGKERAR